MLISPTINSFHGRIFLHTGADPDAGAEFSVTVPARRRWRLHIISFSLVSDDTVTDRGIRVRITDGSRSIVNLFVARVQTASTNITYQLISGLAAETFSTNLHYPLPPHLILPAGSVIESVTNNLQAADNFTPPDLLIEEWIDP